MYQLFMVGAKLLGVYQIISGLLEAFMMVNSAAAPYGTQLAIACFVNLSSGTVLAFFTGVVAKGLRVPEQPADQTPSLSYRPALQIGIVLLGLYQVITVLPRLFARLDDLSGQTVWTRRPFDIVGQDFIGFVAALILVIFAHRIAGLLERVSRQASDPDTI
jgi:hypothetical protein